MRPGLYRRAVLFLPLLAAACGDDEPVRGPSRRDFPPLRYGYLPPIPLNVQRIEMAEDFVRPAGEDELTDATAAETIFAMARDRLKPMTANGTGMFRILTASVALRRDMLTGVLAVRLDLHNDNDSNTGFVEARVTATKTGSIGNRRAAAYDMLKTLMDELNVELEFQIRSKLRGWIFEPPVQTPSPPPTAPGPRS